LSFAPLSGHDSQEVHESGFGVRVSLLVLVDEEDDRRYDKHPAEEDEDGNKYVVLHRRIDSVGKCTKNEQVQESLLGEVHPDSKHCPLE